MLASVAFAVPATMASPNLPSRTGDRAGTATAYTVSANAIDKCTYYPQNRQLTIDFSSVPTSAKQGHTVSLKGKVTRNAKCPVSGFQARLLVNRGRGWAEAARRTTSSSGALGFAITARTYGTSTMKVKLEVAGKGKVKGDVSGTRSIKVK